DILVAFLSQKSDDRYQMTEKDVRCRMKEFLERMSGYTPPCECFTAFFPFQGEMPKAKGAEEVGRR
ncbi:hypothetical protein, partial [Petrimonas sp.]|uniref:hypothetical protein n=1 Tax=Petrimonas sp. TaxID=2023866 RepID=UPI003F5148E0